MTDTGTYVRGDLCVDQQLALRTAACPVFPSIRYENWDLDDPAGLSLAEVRPIRDEIERRVRRLLDEPHVPASRQPSPRPEKRLGTSLQRESTD